MLDAEAHLNQQANPMMYAEDLKQAEYKAEQTVQQAEDLRTELNKLKALNETLVTEVNDSKKREATANLSHYSGSPSSNKKKGATKKKKKFGKNTEGVEDATTGRRSLMDNVANRLNAARRSPAAETTDPEVEMGDMASSGDTTNM